MNVKKSRKIRTQTDFVFDSEDIDELIANWIRESHPDDLPGMNKTVEVSYDISGSGLLLGATASIVRYEEKK